MGTNEWVAIGTIATALFTGGALLLAWSQRQHVKLSIEPSGYLGTPLDDTHASITFEVKNLSSGIVHGVFVRYLYKDGSQPLLDGSVSIPAGESIRCTAQWVIDSAPDVEQRKPGMPPKRFEVPHDSIEVIWLHPPKMKRTKRKFYLLQELIDEQFRREGWME